MLGVAAADAAWTVAAGTGGGAAAAEAAAAVPACAPGSAGLLRMSASRPITCEMHSCQSEQNRGTGINVGSASNTKDCVHMKGIEMSHLCHTLHRLA